MRRTCAYRNHHPKWPYTMVPSVELASLYRPCIRLHLAVKAVVGGFRANPRDPCASADARVAFRTSSGDVFFANDLTTRWAGGGDCNEDSRAEISGVLIRHCKPCAPASRSMKFMRPKRLNDERLLTAPLTRRAGHPARRQFARQLPLKLDGVDRRRGAHIAAWLTPAYAPTACR